MDCVFCKILAGEIPGKILYQDEEVVAFPDINPQAPIHILIIPRKHIPSLADTTEADSALLGHLVSVANQMAKEAGIAQSGYRLVINCGQEGGQVVPHLHLHLLGRKSLSDTLG